MSMLNWTWLESWYCVNREVALGFGGGLVSDKYLHNLVSPEVSACCAPKMNPNQQCILQTDSLLNTSSHQNCWWNSFEWSWPCSLLSPGFFKYTKYLDENHCDLICPLQSASYLTHFCVLMFKVNWNSEIFLVPCKHVHCVISLTPCTVILPWWIRIKSIFFRITIFRLWLMTSHQNGHYHILKYDFCDQWKKMNKSKNKVLSVIVMVDKLSMTKMKLCSRKLIYLEPLHWKQHQWLPEGKTTTINQCYWDYEPTNIISLYPTINHADDGHEQCKQHTMMTTCHFCDKCDGTSLPSPM